MSDPEFPAAEVLPDERGREQLRRSELRFRVAAQACSDIIWEAHLPRGTIEYFGDVDGLLGYGPGEFTRSADAWIEAVHPEDRPDVRHACENAAPTGIYAPPSYRIRRRDGSWIHIEERGAFTELHAGEGIRLVGVATDVTDRVSAERELHRAVAEHALERERLEVEIGLLRAELRDLRARPPATGNEPEASLREALRTVERARVCAALEGADWKIKGRGNAAARLGLSPSTLRSRMKRLGIVRPGTA